MASGSRGPCQKGGGDGDEHSENRKEGWPSTLRPLLVFENPVHS